MGIGRDNKYHWFCICDCGGTATPRGSSLTSGQTQSCGCYMKDRTSEANTKHGELKKKPKTLEYTAWTNMKDRCYNPNMKSFHNYGGRGIKVCDRWMEFAAFLSDMGLKPSKAHSLDRIDFNGDYEPSNCRWATYKEQARNRRGNRKIFYLGKYKLLCEWAEEYGISRQRLKDYVRRKRSFELGLIAAIARTNLGATHE